VNYTFESSLITALVYDDPTRGCGVDEAASGLTVDDFLEEGCRLAFRAMLRLRSEGKPIDSPHIVDAMIEEGVPESRATALYADASFGSPIPGCIPEYAKKIKDQARGRKLAKTINLAGDRLRSGDDAPDVKNQLVQEIEEIETDAQPDEDHRLGDVVMPVLNAMADRFAGDESRKGLRTGIVDLDATTTGFNRGEFWVCGAMPGRGKTALALQVAMNLAGNGFPVYFVSLEMSKDAIVRRLLKMKFGAYVTENPNEKDMHAMLEYVADLNSLPLYINDSSSLEAAELAARSRIRIARSGIRLIIVDYLQIVKGAGRDRREKVSDAADTLRRLAKDTQVPVLALSQLRRPDNLNDRPSMLELKESGDIEAHAHVILLNYMPVGEDGSFAGEEEIIIGKQREGPTGSIPVYFDRSKVIFRERTMHDR
jgi:replicative DNA helicase